MTSASDVVVYCQGLPMDRLSYERFRSENMMVKSAHFGGEKTDIRLLQGIGGAVASGGTHLKPGGCYDTTDFNHKNRQYVGRLLGGADWYRPPNWDGVGGGPHVHHNTLGAGYANPAAKRQWTAYYADKNGLANNAKDPGPRLATKPLFVAPWTARGARGVRYLTKAFVARTEGSTKTKSRGALPKGAKFTVVAVVNNGGVLWGLNKDGLHVAMAVLTKAKPKPPPKPTLRVGTLNFPDKTKITTATEAARIARAVAQIRAANLGILAVQEGVGRRGPLVPSALMAALLAALAADWTCVVPTRDLNENYFFRRKSLAAYKQLPDAVITGKGLPGRHVSLTRFTTAVGSVTLGNTQLVNDDRPGAEVQAGLAAAALKAAAGPKRVLLGDLNTSGPLAGLSASGLVNARVKAVASGNRDAVTYTNQTKTKPSTDPDWLIDGVWTAGLTVNGYAVTQDLDSSGDFVRPRASDHSLVYVSLS
jgi:hypothetical protein